jgi:undecaprenyl-diphosphatase
MIPSLYKFDLHFVHLVNQGWNNPLLDILMAAMSNYPLFQIPLAAVALGLAIFGGFRERVFLVLICLCLLIGDGIIMNGVKHAVNRPRPREALTGVRVVSPKQVEWSNPTADSMRKGHSFPSSHVANNVALALVATMLYGGWAWLFWPWAALMGYARIYVGAHYPSDVLGGGIISLLYTWLIIKLCAWAWRKYAPRLAPKLYARHPLLIDKETQRMRGKVTEK